MTHRWRGGLPVQIANDQSVCCIYIIEEAAHIQ